MPAEIARPDQARATIFSPQDDQRLGLAGMINQLICCDTDLWALRPATPAAVLAGDRSALARAITGAELGELGDSFLNTIRAAAQAATTPVFGITGTGGSGKSSLTDELVRRFRTDQQDKLTIGVVAVDPTRRRGGGALLGDRIRMNALDADRVYVRSRATRGSREIPDCLATVIDLFKAAAYDLVIVETPGIGQGDAAIVPFVDTSFYVMTPELGASSQLEKSRPARLRRRRRDQQVRRRAAKDALRDVSRQLVGNRDVFGTLPRPSTTTVSRRSISICWATSSRPDSG